MDQSAVEVEERVAGAEGDGAICVRKASYGRPFAHNCQVVTIVVFL